VSPADLRAEAAWLYDLTGQTCPWPIDTEHDLREWALNIIDHCENELTGADMRRVSDLIEKLDPPEEQARKARRAKKQAKKQAKYDPDDFDAFIADLEAPFEKQESFRSAGARERKRQGAATRYEIIQKYQKYKSSTEPERERAGLIAQDLGLSSQHVRRVLKEVGLR
jgi:uncharacterized protein (DUF1778 family)